MRTPVGRQVAADAAAMRALGRQLAGHLRAGDLIVLDGPLGAGKTVLVQGIAEGLHVRGRVTSPTFVIARVHPPLGEGPGLVHVDAYRLPFDAAVDPRTALDDLDLDTDLAASVVVVEWGEGLVERLSQDRLLVRIDRPDLGAPADGDNPVGADTGSDNPADSSAGSDDPAGGPRTVTITGYGDRWH